MRKKNSSDRLKLKTKYTIKKKRHDRKIKLKRDMKKNPNKYHKKKSDPGVPNSAPFKMALLDERDIAIDQKAKEKQRKRDLILKAKKAMSQTKVGQKRKLTDVLNLAPAEDKEDSEYIIPDEEKHINLKVKKRRTRDNEDDELMGLSSQQLQCVIEARETARMLGIAAKKQQLEFRRKLSLAKNNLSSLAPDSRFHNWSDRVYYKQVKQVVEEADVLLEVIDARDPLGTRCSTLEDLIRARPSKKLVLVLNKADLVPKGNLEDWLRYLRAEVPTVAFKAAMSRPRQFRRAMDRMVHIGQETLRTPSSMGGDVLLQLLKNYARSFHSSGIVVGVVGLPNVGKSSLINSLKKTKACDVAPTPGSTKSMKRIKLDAKLYLIDSSGVVLPGEDMDPIEAVLRNVVKLQSIRNAEEVATEIFRRSDSLKLALFYEIRKAETGEEFLTLLAKKSKKMVKAGLTDRESAAMKVVYDWNHGILKHYTEAPKRDASNESTTIKAKFVNEFDLDTLAANKEEVFLSYLDPGKPSTSIKLAASKPMESFYELGLNDANQETAMDVQVEGNDADDKATDSGTEQETQDGVAGSDDDDDERREDEYGDSNDEALSSDDEKSDE